MALRLVENGDGLPHGGIVRRKFHESERVVNSRVLTLCVSASRLTVVSARVAVEPIGPSAELDCYVGATLPTGHLVVPRLTLLLKVEDFLVCEVVCAEVFPVRVGPRESVMLVDAAAVVSWPGPVEQIATF